MTHLDRTEVRSMINDVLMGWHSDTVSREVLTNIALDKIEKHLEKINNKVSEHEKIININLPHNISLCPQVVTIKKLEENMITGRALRTYIFAGFGIMGTLFSVGFIIYQIVIK